jgi:glycosyltransferase involved in cell wall biosynthesis
MERSPAVSVLMPAYNAEKHIADAIGSILSQTFADFELIIINDGSTDRTTTILETFAAADSRITTDQQENCGLVASLNRGCRLAKGKYIARMDADDVSLPTRFAKQFDFLEKNSGVGIVGTWIQDMDSNGRLGPVWPLPVSPAVIRWFLMFGNCIAHPTVMARRDVLERLGYYRQDVLHVEDYDLWMRAVAVTNFANIPEVLVKYRVNEDGVSGRNLSDQQRQAALLKCAMISDLADPKFSPEEVRMRLQTTEADYVTTLPEVRKSVDLLLNVYDAYRRKFLLDRSDDAEITLDVIRRIYLLTRSCDSGVSRHWWSVWLSMFRLAPRLCSLRALRKAIRFGACSINNGRYGWTTRRRV